jgi:pyruvate/oxaloacetate carboxyltransferase
MSGLIPPSRVYNLVKLFKQNVSVPVDFHTHCTPGYGLASVVSAIAAGVDIVDTNIWNFAGGPAAPALELIYIFCKKLGVKLDVNMEAVAKINAELLGIRKELDAFDAVKQFPNPFNPLTDTLPTEIEAEFDRAVKAAQEVDEPTLVDACHKIEAYFNFPAPDENVKNAEIPGGMYTNMVAQLKALKNEDILPEAMKLIPVVRLAAGLPPLVTPTSQIVGAQAVNCAVALKNGKPMYANTSVQFVGLVKGEYGHTPVEIDPEFRKKIAGVSEMTPYDTSKYQMQPNPTLDNCGGVQLAENEKEVLLLELFPLVAKDYLTRTKCAAWQSVENERKVKEAAEEAERAAKARAEEEARKPKITGYVIEAPLPGTILEVKVKPGDKVTRGQGIATLEAMKMENVIDSDIAGVVKRIFVEPGQVVAAGDVLVEFE